MTDCQHFWTLTPMVIRARGTCRRCGATRQFTPKVADGRNAAIQAAIRRKALVEAR